MLGKQLSLQLVEEPLVLLGSQGRKARLPFCKIAAGSLAGYALRLWLLGGGLAPGFYPGLVISHGAGGVLQDAAKRLRLVFRKRARLSASSR
jgi:hypothetical protein